MTPTITILQRNSRWFLLALGMLLGACAWLVTAAGNPVLGATSQNPGVQSGESLYQSLGESVVRIEVEQAGPEEFLPNRLDKDDFRGRIMALDFGGSGTGFAFNDEGHIVTSLRNVSGANAVHVILADGRWFEAEVVGTDSYANLAVLALMQDSHDLKALPIAATDPAIGDTVYAFGFADSPSGTLTKGIVSSRNGAAAALQQQGYSLPSSLQSDIQVLPGMNGGPLVNEAGELIGINLGTGSSLFGMDTLNNSIPADLVSAIASVLAAGKDFAYPYLGVSGGSLTVAKAQELQLPNIQGGAFIAAVNPDGPAASGGLTAGDVVTGINGEPVRSFADMAASLLFDFAPTDVISVSVWRQGTSEDLEVVLGERTPSAS